MKKILLLALLLAIPTASRAVTADDYYNAGNQLYQQGQIDKAIQYYQAATQLNPNYWQAYQLIGYCYYSQKNNLQALQAMDQSLQINPNNPPLQQFDTQLRAATPNAPPAGASASANTPAPPSATAANAPATIEKPIFIRLGLGASLPLPTQTQVQYTLGPGGVAEEGFFLNRVLALFLGEDVGLWSAGNSTDSVTAMDISVTANVQFDLLNKNGMKIYLLGGGGLDLISFSDTAGASNSETDPSFHLGGGASFNIGQGLDVFGEIKYTTLFTTEGGVSETFSYVPIQAGISLNL